MKVNANTKRWLQNQPQSYLKKGFNTDKLIRFDSVESGFNSSNKILSVLKQIGQKDLQSYPNPDARKLKEAFSQKHSIPFEMVTVSNGCDELIETIPRITLNPGDNVIVITPTFFRFIDASLRLGANVIFIKSSPVDKFAINGKVIHQAIKTAIKTKAKLIWFCNPNNPTGDITDIALIEKVVRETRAFVAVDQVFADLVEKNNSNKLVELAKTQENIFLLRSLSKTHGLPGIRVGFGIAHPKTINIFEKLRLPFNISSISQKLAIAALKERSLQKTIESIKREREFLFDGIGKLSNLELGANSKTNIFILRHKQKDLFEELLKRNILTADLRTSNGLENLRFVRVTIQDRKKNRLLLHALKNI